jgi:hypothetical protein
MELASFTKTGFEIGTHAYVSNAAMTATSNHVLQLTMTSIYPQSHTGINITINKVISG